MNPEMLELVLNELLEEQKQESVSNAEMISLVRELMKKMEMILQQINLNDSQVLHERARAIQISCREILENQHTHANHFDGIKILLATHSGTSTNSVQTIIKHHHHIKTTTVIAIIISLILIVLTWLYLDTRKEAESNRANDLKYRFLKVHANPGLVNLLLLTDSLYTLDPDSMQNKVNKLELQQTRGYPLPVNEKLGKVSNKKKPSK